MPQTPAPTKSDGKLSLVEYAGFALGDTASNFFFKFFSLFLLYYYTDVFGIDAAAAGTMFLVTRAFDALTDPAMGILADRTKTRWGKYRPYLLWMAIPYGICGYLIFANPDLESAGKLVYAYITYSLMMLAYTAINVPYSSLMGVLSPSSRARTIASSFRFAGAFGGGLLVTTFVRPLVEFLGGDDEVLGFQYTMAIFAVLSVALFWVTFATTKERVQPPEEQTNNAWEEIGELFKNRPWMILFVAAIFSTTFIGMKDSVTLHYFKYNVGSDKTPIFWILDRSSVFMSVGMLSMMIGAILMGFVSQYFDKKWLSFWLTFATSLCLVAFFFVPPGSFATLVVLNALTSFLMGPTSAIVWAMYGDVADYGEHKFGRRSTGLIHSASLFSLKAGGMIAGFLAGRLLGQIGYVPNAEQSESSLLGIRLMFSVIPAVFALGKAISLWVYPLDARTVIRIEVELRERKARQRDPGGRGELTSGAPVA